jgi:hypothetical protein
MQREHAVVAEHRIDGGDRRLAADDDVHGRVVSERDAAHARLFGRQRARQRAVEASRSFRRLAHGGARILSRNPPRECLHRRQLRELLRRVDAEELVR